MIKKRFFFKINFIKSQKSFFFLTRVKFQYISILYIDLNLKIQLGSNDTQFEKFLKIIIFTYARHFFNIRPHFRGTFLNFVKNVF